MKGAEERLKREHNARAWQAWVTACLPGNPKTRLDDLTFRDRPAARPRSWEDEFAAFDAWASATKH